MQILEIYCVKEMALLSFLLKSLASMKFDRQIVF